MIFDIKKENLWRKARLVVEEHILDSIYLESCLLVVQLISIRILLSIVAKYGLKVVSRDVGNVSPYNEIIEKVYAITRPEFGERERRMSSRDY